MPQPDYFALEAVNAGFVSVELAPDSGGLVCTFAAVPEPLTLSLPGTGVLFTVLKASPAADILLAPNDPVFVANASIISQFQTIPTLTKKPQPYEE